MRFSTQYQLAGPRTFRRGSRKIFRYWGGNAQNWEKNLRQIFISDGLEPGLLGRCKYWLETGDISVFTEEELALLKVILQRDQAGAEALIVAYDCENGDYRSLFLNGIKVHVYTALKLFKEEWKEKCVEHKAQITADDIEILDVTKIPNLKQNPQWEPLRKLIASSDYWPQHERFYFLAKKIVHAYNNGLSAPPSLRRYILEGSEGKVVISKDDSIRFLQFYSALFPELNNRAQRYRTLVERGNRTIYNFFGMPFQITTENINEKLYRDIQTWPQQSTVGEITRIAFSELQYYIEEHNKRWDILVDGHDSYAVQCPLMDVKECDKKMEEFMNIEMESPIDGSKFRMKSEGQVGFNLGPYKKEVNELGLRELNWL